MTLADLIRKRDTGNTATAIPAIPATQPKREAATVARIATVAVANPTEEEATSTWWLIHYADRDPVEMSCSPPATHAEVMDGHPAALAAEPFEPTPRTTGAPMTSSEERAVRAWLARIEESDQATIDAVLNVCRADPDALAYYLRRAAE
jgi:hypothetical protein